MSATTRHARVAAAIWVVAVAGSWCASADVVIWLEHEEVTVAPASVFSTELKILSWGNVVGAFSAVLMYDPEVVRVRGVCRMAESAFDDNLFIDWPSCGLADCRLVAFQTSHAVGDFTTVTVARIRWEAIGSSGSASDLTLMAERVIDSAWKPVEVLLWSTSVQLEGDPALLGDFNNDDDVDLDDFNGYPACMTGPNAACVADCDDADLDADCDSDLADFALFQRSFTGAS